MATLPSLGGALAHARAVQSASGPDMVRPQTKTGVFASKNWSPMRGAPRMGMRRPGTHIRWAQPPLCLAAIVVPARLRMPAPCSPATGPHCAWRPWSCVWYMAPASAGVGRPVRVVGRVPGGSIHCRCRAWWMRTARRRIQVDSPLQTQGTSLEVGDGLGDTALARRRACACSRRANCIRARYGPPANITCLTHGPRSMYFACAHMVFALGSARARVHARIHALSTWHYVI